MDEPEDKLPDLPKLPGETDNPAPTAPDKLPIDIEKWKAEKESRPKETTDFEKWQEKRDAKIPEQTDFEKWQDKKISNMPAPPLSSPRSVPQQNSSLPEPPKSERPRGLPAPPEFIKEMHPEEYAPIPEFPELVEPMPFVPEIAEGAEDMPEVGGPLPKPAELKNNQSSKQAAYQEQQRTRREDYQSQQQKKREIYQERKSMGLPGAGPDPTPDNVPLPQLPGIGGGGNAAGGGMDLAETNKLLQEVINLLTQIKDAKGGFR